MCWTPLCMCANMVLISLIRLYSLYAFQHSEVIHTTAFYIQLLLIFAPILTSLCVLTSAWHTPSESTLWAKTLSSTKHIKQYRQVPRSGSDPQISFGKCSMRRDSGGMEDMSNPPTVNWRSINSKRIHHQPTEKYWIHL